MDDNYVFDSSVVTYKGIRQQQNCNNFYFNGRILSECEEEVDFFSTSKKEKISNQIFALCEDITGINSGNISYRIMNAFSKYQINNKIEKGSNLDEIVSNISSFIEDINKIELENLSLDSEDKKRVVNFLSLIVHEKKCAILNSGKNWAYHVRGDKIKRLTSKNNYENISILDKDVFLVSSHGLSNNLKNEKIHKIINEYKDSDIIAKNLLEEVLKNGVDDNITVIVIKALDYKDEDLNNKESLNNKFIRECLKPKVSKTKVAIAIICLVLLGVGGIYGGVNY